MEGFNTFDINATKADIGSTRAVLEKVSSGLVGLAELFAEFDEPELSNLVLELSEKSYHLLTDIKAIERRFDFRWRYGKAPDGR